MAISSNKKISPKEYLDFEKGSENRHEYYYGKLFKLNSESKTSLKINNNLLLKWDNLLEEQKLILTSKLPFLKSTIV